MEWRREPMTQSQDLLNTLALQLPRLAALEEARADRRPAPARWSAKEELGHLVDSALVNTARFARAVGRDDLVFEGYDQDRWSKLFGDGDVPWAETLELWLALNRRLARLLAALPDEELRRPRSSHSLETIAWRALPPGATATLDWLVEDYLGHMKHHLDRIEG